MSMFSRVIEASYIKDHVIGLRFEDGITGEVDLADRLFGEIFEPLKDTAYFGQFRVDPDLHTVVWPNGADFAPEFLYERVQVPV